MQKTPMLFQFQKWTVSPTQISTPMKFHKVTIIRQAQQLMLEKASNFHWTKSSSKELKDQWWHRTLSTVAQSARQQQQRVPKTPLQTGAEVRLGGLTHSKCNKRCLWGTDQTVICNWDLSARSKPGSLKVPFTTQKFKYAASKRKSRHWKNKRAALWARRTTWSWAS